MCLWLSGTSLIDPTVPHYSVPAYLPTYPGTRSDGTPSSPPHPCCLGPGRLQQQQGANHCSVQRVQATVPDYLVGTACWTTPVKSHHVTPQGV